MVIKVMNDFLPPAEEEKLGAIKVGDTLDIDNDNVLNMDATSVLGKFYSNCITEIPQIVKLELNGTTLTLKAGSKAYIPAGANNTFNEYTVTDDLVWSQSGTWSGNYFVCIYNTSTSPAFVIETLGYQSGTEFPESPSEGTKFYKADDNMFYRYDGSVWRPFDATLPLAIVNLDNGVVKSIQQVFNGATYWGHHAFIYSGIRGAAPNGINDNGTVNSSDLIRDDITVYDLTTANITSYNNLFITLGDNNGVWRVVYIDADKESELIRQEGVVQYIYEKNTDYYWDTATSSYNKTSVIPFIEVSLKDSVVTYFRIIQPLRLASIEDKNEDNSYFLFDFKWADHIPNKLSWLRADTFSWQDGNVYTAAYNHLLSDYNNRIIGDAGDQGDGWYKETISGQDVWYIKGPDGHKICVANNESAVQTVYNSTGVAWYYILDRDNIRFKLPRTKFGFTGVRDGVGRYVAPGVPNITGEFSVRRQNNAGTLCYKSGAFSDGGLKGESNSIYYSTDATSQQQRISFNASNVSSIYGASSTVQPPATQMYLYAYVGYTDQEQLKRGEININALTTDSLSQIDNDRVNSLTQINNTKVAGIAAVNAATEEGINRLNTDSNALNRTQITNCVTEIPQDIKLEVNYPNLVLKSGSKVYIPNGTNIFDEVTISDDVIYDLNLVGTNTRLIFYNRTLNELSVCPVSLCYSSTSEPTLGNTFGIWYDLTTNTIKRTDDSGTTWVSDFSLPISVASMVANTSCTIDQVFNGMGYIDSTYFALPGIKGLIPNGRNADGTLNNLEYTLDHLLTKTISSTSTQNSNFYGIELADGEGVPETQIVVDNSSIYYEQTTQPDLSKAFKWFDTYNNIQYYHSPTSESFTGLYRIRNIKCGRSKLTNGIISNFTPLKAFQAPDLSTMDYVIDFKVPTSSSCSWYRRYKSGWVEQGGMFTNSARLTTVTFLIPMADTNYTALSNLQYGSDSWTASVVTCIAANSRTTTNMKVLCYYNNSQNTGPICWRVDGFMANSNNGV